MEGAVAKQQQAVATAQGRVEAASRAHAEAKARREEGCRSGVAAALLELMQTETARAIFGV